MRVERDGEKPRPEMRGFNAARRVGELSVDQRTRIGAVRGDEGYGERFSAQRGQRKVMPTLVDEVRLAHRNGAPRCVVRSDCVTARSWRCGRTWRRTCHDFDYIAHSIRDVVIRAADEVDARLRKRYRNRSAGIERSARIARAQNAVSARGERKARILWPVRRRTVGFCDDIEAYAAWSTRDS